MLRTLVLERKTIKTKPIVTILGIISCVALPQLFHLLGAASGLGTAPGAAFLPMHLPVIFVGLLCGGAAGIICGAISPLVSFAISGMPTAAMLPIMMTELAAYGFIAGILADKKMPVIAKVAVTQAAGRIIRALAIVAAIYLFGSNIQISQIWTAVYAGLPGIALQLCLIPLLMYRVDNISE